MRQEHQALQVAYRLLQEKSEAIKMISARSPTTAPLNDHLLALNDAMSELIAEMAFLLERGALDSELFARRVEEILGPLSTDHRAHLASLPSPDK